jgi:hypothetical protein
LLQSWGRGYLMINIIFIPFYLPLVSLFLN